MGRIPEEIISDVLSKSDMLQIVGEYVSLKRAGASYKGCCPFHNEKTPSFNINPDRGFFKCFGCGEGGSLFTFMMKIEGWSFPEAVRNLAARVGVEIPEVSDEDAETARRKAQAQAEYHDIMGAAQRWFEAQLWEGRDPTGREYLKTRGVDEATARVFGLGYAPDGWSTTFDYLTSQGFSRSLCERSGLIKEGGRGGHYDRFRSRLMFPVVNIWGKTVAFGGRRLKDGEKDGAKYINSPETVFYRKGNELYGLGATKSAIRAAGEAVLVEGNFDVVVLYAQGVKNVACPMGTALTERQVRLLSRYSKKIYVAFDGDKAGRSAVNKSLPSLVSQQLDARVVSMPDGEDPDSFLRTRGLEAWSAALESARPIVAFALDQLIDIDVEGAPVEQQVRVLKEAGEILQHVQDRFVWERYAQEIARRLEIPWRHIRGHLRQPERLLKKVAPRPVVEPAPHAQPTSPGPGQAPEVSQEPAPVVVEPRAIPLLEAECFRVLSDLPEKLDEFMRERCCDLFRDERLILLMERVFARHQETGRAPEYAMIAEPLSEELGDPDFFAQISSILCSARAYDAKTIERTYMETMVTLQRRWLEREEKLLTVEEERAAQSLDEALQFELLRRRKALIDLRKELDLPYQRSLVKANA